MYLERITEMMNRVLVLVVLLAILTAPSATANNQVRFVPDDEEVFGWCGNYLPDVGTTASRNDHNHKFEVDIYWSVDHLAALRCTGAFVDVEFKLFGVDPDYDDLLTLYTDTYTYKVSYVKFDYEYDVETGTMVRFWGIDPYELTAGPGRFELGIENEAFKEGVTPAYTMTLTLSQWWEADGNCEPAHVIPLLEIGRAHV